MKKKEILILVVIILISLGVFSITFAYLSTGTMQDLANSFQASTLK